MNTEKITNVVTAAEFLAMSYDLLDVVVDTVGFF